MALSRELLKRLNSEEEPMPKRLKLAESAFHTVDLPIVRREDLILQWLCAACPLSSDAWNSLQHCLKIQHFEIKADVKKLLIKVLIERLNEETGSVNENVLECCRLLVSNTGMQQYFINEPKDLGLLTKSLLNNVHKHFIETLNIHEQSTEGINVSLINSNCGLTLLAYNTVISIIESMMHIFKSSNVAKDNWGIMFVRDVLYSLCVIIDHKCTDSTNRLGAVAHKCVQQILFGKKHTQNKGELNADNTEFTKVFSILAEIAKVSNLQETIMTFVFVFRAAIGVYKSDGNMLDFILRELVKCAEPYNKEVLSAFLKHVSDITFDFDNKINDVSLSVYCYNIIDTSLLNGDMTVTDYELLTQFSYLNPLIIEKKIHDILKKLFLQEQRMEYTNLIIAILDASIRLRREEKMISQILIALKQTSEHKLSKGVQEFFPQEFKNKFSKSVNNITNSQVTAILRTLIFHLNTDCVQVLQSNETCNNVLIMKATIELLVAFFEGICIFEYTGTLNTQQKFVNALDDLGNVLSVLVDKALHLNHNKDIIVILLTAISSWNKVQNALNYYVPKVITKELTPSISEEHWQQLFQRITNFGEEDCRNSMNELILHRFMTSQNKTNQSLIKLSKLIGGTEHSWKQILELNTDAVQFLNNKEIIKITCLLLENIISNVESFQHWMDILRKDSLQENKTFVISILSCVLIKIGDLSSRGVTNSITRHVDTKSLIETESNASGKIVNVIIAMKNDLLKNDWSKVVATTRELQICLEILLHLPLMFLSTQIRTVVFMVIYAVSKEYDKYEQITCFCYQIFSDILEKPGIDILEYLDSELLINHLPQNKAFKKAMEQSFRSNISYTVLKKLIKSSEHCKETMYALLDSMESVKSKLTIDQKLVLKKAERKLSKTMMSALAAGITEPNEVKTLTLVLKVNISNESVNDDLKNIAESTLHTIFADKESLNKEATNKLIEEGLQLAAAILHNHNTFKLQDETIRVIWFAMFKCPCKDLLLPLLASSGPKEFSEVLECLHTQMVESIANLKVGTLESMFIMWDAILKTDMSNARKKLRLAGINKLVQAVQSLPLPEKCWPSLLRLFQNILSTKHLHLPGNVIDMTILVGLKSLEEVKIVACNDALTLCSILIKVRTSFITDRLPTLLLLYRSVLRTVIHASKEIGDKREEHLFRCLVLNIEKFTVALLKLKKDMVRLSPYLVADLLELFSEASIAPFVKASIQNCISQLISVCDQHGIALLSRTLPVSMQEIFKIQLDAFNKFYKFSGKI